MIAESNITYLPMHQKPMQLTSITTLSGLIEYHKRELEALEFAPNHLTETSHHNGRLVRVRGLLFRKRKLSSVLRESCMFQRKAGPSDGLSSNSSIPDMYFVTHDLHLGDLIIVEAIIQTKSLSSSFAAKVVLDVHSVLLIEPWKAIHPSARFDAVCRESDRILHSAKVSTQVATAGKYINMVLIQGKNACKYHFNGGKNGTSCLRGADCHFWHGELDDYDKNKKIWAQKRIQQRLELSQLDGDDIDPHSKAFKAKRARIFCEWLSSTFGEKALRQGSGVVDVAGGRGEISFDLWNRRGIPTTLIDPRPLVVSKRRLKQLAKYGREQCPHIESCLTDELIAKFGKLFNSCSLLVGMHPDEATEAIVDTSLALRKPFAVVPCCVMTRKFPERRSRDGTFVATYSNFVQYLMEKDARIKTSFLPFAGQNQVLYIDSKMK
ncbi:unnamed protein product [Albugo candida]|uniref:C3H1-type domain-containing protein n=1 Tax=Albugo candida TaxID=65357 RepID=A0A024GVA5_9STRA|nr:unnamed protein product [Albugo candida]|eukprot:CCI50514.1 unnamed protein product [Albugo candida]